MDEMTIRAAFEVYEGCLEKALEIARGWETHGVGRYIDEPDSASLEIDNDIAILIWSKARSSWHDDLSVENEEWEFPARLLWESEAELCTWRAEERARKERESVVQATKNRADAEARERAIYEALKAKFGDKP